MRLRSNPLPLPKRHEYRLLEERVTSTRPMNHDASQHIVRDVKIVGSTSKNRRHYPPETLLAAAPLYEGKTSYIGHGTSGTAREYAESFGTIRNVRFLEGDLVADLHYNPRHALAEQFVYDAEHAPARVGLSHRVIARTRHNGRVELVEHIKEVKSVDITPQPATTHSLYESETTMETPTDTRQLRESYPELVAALTREVTEQVQAEQRDGHDQAKLVEENRQLRTEVAELRRAQKAAERRAEIVKRLDDRKITHDAALVESLVGLSDDQLIPVLDRLAATKDAKPRSSERAETTENVDDLAASAIRRKR